MAAAGAERAVWSHQTERDFLARLAASGNMSEAAAAVGATAAEARRRARRIARFGSEVADAIASFDDRLEAELIDRALNGSAKSVFHGGKEVGVERVFSDRLAIFLLQARKPETYARRPAAAPAKGAEGALGKGGPRPLHDPRIEAARIELEAKLAALTQKLGDPFGAGSAG